MRDGSEASYRVRRIARRAAPGPALTLSNERIWRKMQRRSIGSAAFFVLAIGALVYRKASARFGALVPAVFLAALVAVPFAAIRIQGRKDERGEDGDLETEAPAPAIESQLLAGTLSPGDLVYEDQHWTTLLESIRFGEAAGDVDAKARRAARLRMTLYIVLGVAAALPLIGLIANSGDVLQWLIDD